jgi:hypothetical protein
MKPETQVRVLPGVSLDDARRIIGELVPKLVKNVKTKSRQGHRACGYAWNGHPDGIITVCVDRKEAARRPA